MITLNQVQLIRGSKRLLDNASLTIYPGHKVALVGANGCGKSSLLSLLLEQVTPDAGDMNLPKGWRIATVDQETPALSVSALDYVLDGDRHYRALETALVEAQTSGEGKAIAASHDAFEAYHGYQIPARAAELLNGLGFDQQAQGKAVKAFSGGWRMRLNLARALLVPSDLLLLDEPTNHLDLDTLIWLETWLKRYQGTLVLISHDRDFLDQVAEEVVHIEHQRLNHYKGNYSQFERQRAEHLAQQQAQFEKQQRQKAHMQAFVDRFRYKASKAKQAQSRLKALEKMQELAPLMAQNQFKIEFREPDALPNPLVQMDQVQGGYGDVTVLEQIKLNLVPGSRIGLLGRNGAGKSTLIKMLAGELTPMGGELFTNPALKIGYFAQHQLETLHPEQTPLQHLTLLAKEATEQQLRDYLGGFGFSGDKALEKVAPFSGGEKARLVLALLIWQRPNLLLLDEPTNHLDLELREALTLALQQFEGAMVVVSHDRHLLRATCSEFYLVDQGRVGNFEGDLEDYYRWLMQQNRSIEETNDAPSQSEQKKNRKRQEAELRQKLSPLRKKETALDKQMAKLQTRLAVIEETLAESRLYTDENKSELTQLLQERGDIQSSLEELEMDWLEIQEQIETIRSAAEEQ
ncbi:ATP-binding cassette domain-containing protein [Ferrimonas aestuarii]|uniref:Probable ATP-binding protein YheS n=1 Tax=Ferrimonas aestuarii TaxID=2569539 RepID=A0A4U1BLG8_9GAMM|nr:ATP-binding cassette domain-containing protein [Ferrimonas aestuarii]TKB50942.1 ATP-binding cassette domain-containing protein [Ferrimonas aestuarii]